MLKIVLAYILITGLIMVLGFTFFDYKELNSDLESIAKDHDVETRKVLFLTYIVLMLSGWAFLPLRIFKSVINKIKGK